MKLPVKTKAERRDQLGFIMTGVTLIFFDQFIKSCFIYTSSF